MSLIQKQMHLFFLVILFILVRLSNTQLTPPPFRPSVIELMPSFVILNSTSSANFSCINHQSDNSSLIISLSKNISRNRLQIETNQFDNTTIHITLQSIDYIGIFYLLCYDQEKPNEGTRADVIVKTQAGVLQLIKRCQVYDKHYIKCLIRAPILARAIVNGFVSEIEFTEITNLQPYKKSHKFLENESTEEYLVFTWMPTTDGHFPDGVIMNMKISLPHFGISQYRFDMTPSFAIKPNFILKNPSKSQVLFQLISNSPPAICETSIQSKAYLHITRTWIAIESNRMNITINDSSSNPTYQICVRCRQTTNDLYGDEECQEIRPLHKPNVFLKMILPIICILCIILLVVIFIVIYLRRQNKTVAGNESGFEHIPKTTNDEDNRQQFENSYLPLYEHSIPSAIQEDDASPEPNKYMSCFYENKE